MASAAQIAANQANARRSTGPRTAEGKAASARNATSHGLSSADFVILAGQEEEFSAFIDALRAEIQPAGAIEHELFAQHAHAAWTLRRCRRAEVASQLDSVCDGADPLLASELANQLKRIDLYMRRAERTFHKTLKELRTFQTNRFSMEVPDLIAGCGGVSIPPVLVEVERVFRQHATFHKTRDAQDLADYESFVLTGKWIRDGSTPRGLRNTLAPADAFDLIKQTQSPPPATFTAGGSS